MILVVNGSGGRAADRCNAPPRRQVAVRLDAHRHRRTHDRHAVSAAAVGGDRRWIAHHRSAVLLEHHANARNLQARAVGEDLADQLMTGGYVIDDAGEIRYSADAFAFGAPPPAEMRELKPLVGDYAGEGWMIMPGAGRMDLTGGEIIEDLAKQEEESSKVITDFMSSLSVDEDVAGVLVEEGFTTLEEIAYVPLEEMMTIEGFDEELAEELQNRAKEALDRQEAAHREARRELGVEDDLAELPHMTEAMLVTLGKAGLKTLDDVADLATDELIAKRREAPRRRNNNPDGPPMRRDRPQRNRNVTRREAGDLPRQDHDDDRHLGLGDIHALIEHAIGHEDGEPALGGVAAPPVVDIGHDLAPVGRRLQVRVQHPEAIDPPGAPGPQHLLVESANGGMVVVEIGDRAPGRHLAREVAVGRAGEPVGMAGHRHVVDGAVVEHHVQDHPHPSRVRGVQESCEAGVPAQLVGHGQMVLHRVGMGRDRIESGDTPARMDRIEHEDLDAQLPQLVEMADRAVERAVPVLYVLRHVDDDRA